MGTENFRENTKPSTEHAVLSAAAKAEKQKQTSLRIARVRSIIKDAGVVIDPAILAKK
jgi:ribosomal protein S11